MCWACAAFPSTLTLGTMRRLSASPGGGGAGGGSVGALPARGLGGVPPLAAGIGLLLVGAAVLLPGSLQFKLDVLGFGVCHQLLSHSLIIGGHPLPVCARCTGIYLGAFVTWILLSVLRPRATGLPAPRMLALLGLGFLAMVADGINSTFESFPGGHGLWVTTNLLRITTGGLAGIALVFVLYPVANSALRPRAEQRAEPVLEAPYELFGYLVLLGVLIALGLSSDGDVTTGWVYWLLAGASMISLIGLLTATNLLFTATLTRREGRLTGRAALSPIAIALVVALVELLLLTEARTALTPLIAAAGPLPPDLPLAPGIR